MDKLIQFNKYLTSEDAIGSSELIRNEKTINKVKKD